MTLVPLMIGSEERANITTCLVRAIERPVNMDVVLQATPQSEARQNYRKQMDEQTVLLPTNYSATFSIETGVRLSDVKLGTVRHLSVALMRADHNKVPAPEAVWMIAQEFGFTGDGIRSIDLMYTEDIDGGRKAVNIIQKMR